MNSHVDDASIELHERRMWWMSLRNGLGIEDEFDVNTAMADYAMDFTEACSYVRHLKDRRQSIIEDTMFLEDANE